MLIGSIGLPGGFMAAGGPISANGTVVRRQVGGVLSGLSGALRERALRILDVGSAAVEGVNPYRGIFDRGSWSYVGVDIAAGPNVDVVLENPYDWHEIQDQSFDVVISHEAFEHIEFMWISILEVARVLKTNGLVAIVAPARGIIHRYPTDCWRFYPDGLPGLARYAGLRVLESHIQRSYAYPVADQWSQAILIGQRPERDATEEAERRVRTEAAKLVIQPHLDAGSLAGLRLTPVEVVKSAIAPVDGLDAIRQREVDLLRSRSRLRIRSAIFWMRLRHALRALYRPFGKLTQF